MRRRALIVLVLTLAVASATLAIGSTRQPDKTIVATFARTTSLYEGARVKVLGVTIGRVDDIQVNGTTVTVRIAYDADVKLPADAHALIVPPSIVGDRFVQLAPAYASGPVLPDGATLGLDHTGVPLELDDNYRALDKLAIGLGPSGANQDGALSRLVQATALNLSGHGRDFNQTVRQMALALETLENSSSDGNATIRNLDKLTKTLAGNDQTIRRLVTLLAAVSSELNGQRGGIAAATRTLRTALRDLSSLAEHQGSDLTRTIDDLTAVLGILENHKDVIGESIQLAPVGLVSVGNIYVPKNWDPTRPWETPPGGRASSAAIRSAALQDLTDVMGQLLNGLCVSLPKDQISTLAGMCMQLQQTGGDLGGLLSELLNRSGASALDPVTGKLTGGTP